MVFYFKTQWNSTHDAKADGAGLVNALVATGRYTELEAVAFVNAFQNNAFSDGENEEAFNHCGEEA